MKRIFLVFCVLMTASCAFCEQEIYSLIDIPTANALNTNCYDISFRFYSGGGVLSRMSFGVLKRINIGFGWDLDKLVGTDDVDVQEPTLNVKFRLFDGDNILPAFALGYDGQGYNYDKVSDEYRAREKGVFLAASNEIFVPGLEYTIGGNMYDFKEDKVYGFAGLSMTFGDAVTLMAEYDNIHNTKQNRFNGGIRYFVTPNIFVDFSGRDMGSADRDAERIARINYVGSF